MMQIKIISEVKNLTISPSDLQWWSTSFPPWVTSITTAKQ